MAREQIEGPQINTQGLQAEITILKEHMLIASFIGEKPLAHFLVPWLTTLNQAISHGKLIYKHKARLKFRYI